jgi:ABC-2 type transport system permease protein
MSTTHASGGTKLGMILTVALWEFGRFFKWRDQLIALSLAVVGGAVGYFSTKLIAADKPKTATVAVINTTGIVVASPPTARVQLVPPGADDEATLRQKVKDGKLDGLLLWKDKMTAEVVVEKEPPWKAELEQLMTQSKTSAEIIRTGIPVTAVSDILNPVKLTVKYFDDTTEKRNRMAKLAAGVCVTMVVIGTFFALAYLFTGITGEKQQRVTEQIVSAIGPQAWIDGKVLGVCLTAIAQLTTYGVIAAVLITGFMLWRGKNPAILLEGFSLPLVAVFLIMAAGSLALWNCFFAAVAATINDPNTSARSSLMFLPMLPTGFGFAALNNPDSTLMKVTSLIPGTSSAVLPARMAMGEVAWWEVAVAIALLAAAVWVMRRIAGKIFAAGILMHGKEPSIKEMWRWLTVKTV